MGPEDLRRLRQSQSKDRGTNNSMNEKQMRTYGITFALLAAMAGGPAARPLLSQEAGTQQKEAPQTASGDQSGAMAKDSGSPAESMGGKDYRVGPGDMIEVSVWKEPAASTTVVVRPDGKLSLPLVNDLAVSGMTPMEIQALVEKKLEPFISVPSVTVIVRQILSKKIYVIGQVGSPGAYLMTQPVTILQILTQAGGLRQFAKSKSIYVLRTENGKQQKLPFNYEEVLEGKRIEQDIPLQAGDTVVVP